MIPYLSLKTLLKSDVSLFLAVFHFRSPSILSNPWSSHVSKRWNWPPIQRALLWPSITTPHSDCGQQNRLSSGWVWKKNHDTLQSECLEVTQRTLCGQLAKAQNRRWTFPDFVLFCRSKVVLTSWGYDGLRRKAMLQEWVLPPDTNEAELRLPVKAMVFLRKSESLSDSKIPPIRDWQAQL